MAALAALAKRRKRRTNAARSSGERSRSARTDRGVVVTEPRLALGCTVLAEAHEHRPTVVRIAASDNPAHSIEAVDQRGYGGRNLALGGPEVHLASVRKVLLLTPVDRDLRLRQRRLDDLLRSGRSLCRVCD